MDKTNPEQEGVEPKPGKRPPGVGSRGPLPQKLSTEQREEYLGLIRGGFGRYMALRRMGVSPGRFRRETREDEEFRYEIECAYAYRIETRVYNLSLHADGDPEKGIEPDHELSLQLLRRDDQQIASAEAMRLKRAELKLKKQEEERRAVAEKQVLTDIAAGARTQAAAEMEVWRREMRESLSNLPTGPPGGPQEDPGTTGPQ